MTQAVSTVERPRAGSSVLWLVGGISAAVVLLYLDSFASLAGMWSDSEYQHGAIVWPISAFLLWRLRPFLESVELEVWPKGVPLLLWLVGVWLAAKQFDVRLLEHVAVVLMVPAAVAVYLGPALLKRAAFPLFFLLASVPIGEELVPYLMVFTADLSSALLRLFGVPVFRDGQFLSLPGGEFEIADVCSGLRYLAAGTVLAVLYAYVTFAGARKRIAFVGFVMVVLVVANSVRAFLVMAIASATKLRWMAGQDHVYFGWILFAATIALVLMVGARFADRPAQTPSVSTGVAASASRWPLVIGLGVAMLALTAQRVSSDFSNVWLLLGPLGVAALWFVAVRLGETRASDARSERVFSGHRGARAAAAMIAGAVVLALGPVVAAWAW